jgi:hypothetical protein
MLHPAAAPKRRAFAVLCALGLLGLASCSTGLAAPTSVPAAAVNYATFRNNYASILDTLNAATRVYETQFTQDQLGVTDQQIVEQLSGPYAIALSDLATSLSNLTVPNTMLGDLHRFIGTASTLADDVRAGAADWPSHTGQQQYIADIASFNSAKAIFTSDINSLPQ